MNIPPYNGGLFAKDDFLQQLEIPDAVCRHFYDIGRYDYRSLHEALEDTDEEATGTAQVDVDILGHIFEQSISDLEQIRNELDGLIPPSASSNGSSRKSIGRLTVGSFSGTISKFVVCNGLQLVTPAVDY